MCASALSSQPNEEQKVRRIAHIPLVVRSLSYITLVYSLVTHGVICNGSFISNEKFFKKTYISYSKIMTTVITFIIALFILLYIIWYRVDSRLGDLGVSPHPTGTGRTTKSTHPISCRNLLSIYVSYSVYIKES